MHRPAHFCSSWRIHAQPVKSYDQLLETLIGERYENGNCHHLATIVKKRDFQKSLKAPFLLVGTARFELTTSRTPSERATRLRYVPKNVDRGPAGLRHFAIFRLGSPAQFVNFNDLAGAAMLLRSGLS